MTFITRLASFLTPFLGALLAGGSAWAVRPEPNAIGLQPPASPTMVAINDFHNLLLWLITAISLFVLALMVYVMVRFREKANPNPTKTTHNVAVEVAWTVVPIIILVALAVPSLRLLYYTDRLPPDDVEMTIKAIGKQWYWSYEYPDFGNFTFDSVMTAKDDLPDDLKNQYLLETDTEVVLPVGVNIRVIVTAGDVLHNWAIPALGIKLDAVPGRLN
ncbi:MAG: cytochrome c oxidase subunit II transmembrane domain-containing protein, partial [Kiloniellales bacterium]|nr:cytochrome c oxidase subunit II transmembrane domain-containing protein [Kiloniellales bacterium]